MKRVICMTAIIIVSLVSCEKENNSESENAVPINNDGRIRGLYEYNPNSSNPKRVYCDLCGNEINGYDYDLNNDGYLQQSEIEQAKTIYLKYMGSGNSIGGLSTWLRPFTSLEHLLVEIPADDYGSEMDFTHFGHNLICINLGSAAGKYYTPGINLSSCSNLEYLKFFGGEGGLLSIDVTPCPKLKKLEIGNGNLLKLDLSNNKYLVELDCSSNDLLTLDISKNENLEYLDCSDNLLSSIDLSKNVNLKYLNCGSNYIETLDISCCQYLETVWCNGVKTLYISNSQKDKEYISSITTNDPDCNIIIK